jgi:tetratricopeptide (TPR) repeat protein
MPDSRELSDKALGLAESGHYEEALDLISKGINIDANNANLWYNKGIILFKMCRFQDALNSFSQAADIDPGFTEAWVNKGVVLMELGKNLAAIRAFDKAIALNPGDSQARHYRDLAQKKIIDSSSFSPSPSKDQTKLFK